MGFKVVKYHLVSTVLQKGVEVGDVVPGSGRHQENINIDKGQCGSPDSTARTSALSSSGSMAPYQDKSNGSTTTASGRVIALDGGITYELLEGGVHSNHKCN